MESDGASVMPTLIDEEMLQPLPGMHQWNFDGRTETEKPGSFSAPPGKRGGH